jgi:hypothetical protein
VKAVGKHSIKPQIKHVVVKNVKKAVPHHKASKIVKEIKKILKKPEVKKNPS